MRKAFSEAVLQRHEAELAGYLEMAGGQEAGIQPLYKKHT